MEDKVALQDDLRFIRGAVSQHETQNGSPAVGLVWGVATMLGYPLLDWRPEYEGLYWMVAGPLGGFLCWWLARKQAHAVGEDRRRESRKWMLHWIVTIGASFLTFPLIATGLIQPAAVGPLILIFVTLGLAMGAVHSVPRLGWYALTLLVGYGLLFIVKQYVWTLIGILFFACSLMNYLQSRKAHG